MQARLLSIGAPLLRVGLFALLHERYRTATSSLLPSVRAFKTASVVADQMRQQALPLTPKESIREIRVFCLMACVTLACSFRRVGSLHTPPKPIPAVTQGSKKKTLPLCQVKEASVPKRRNETVPPVIEKPEAVLGSGSGEPQVVPPQSNTDTEQEPTVDTKVDETTAPVDEKTGSDTWGVGQQLSRLMSKLGKRTEDAKAAT